MIRGGKCLCMRKIGNHFVLVKRIQTKKVIKWLLLILWLGFIFYMSSESGGTSSNTSGRVLNIVESVLPFVKDNVKFFTMLIRKSAHILEYFILGILIFEVIKEYRLSNKEILLFSLLLSLLCATMDEIHQLFVVDRVGRIMDVAIDSIGYVLSICLLFLKKDKSVKKRLN